MYVTEKDLREAIMRVKGIVIVDPQKIEDLKKIVEILPAVTGDFPITSVCRDDLGDYDFDVEKITDDNMRELADKMGDDYCEQMFHESMKIIAEDMGLPKIRRKKDVRTH